MTKDDFKFYFPFIGTLFVVFGAIKLVLFYGNFGIDVVSYLDFSEIITLFLQDLLVLGAVVVFFFLLSWRSLLSDKSESERSGFKLIVKEKNFSKRLQFYFKTHVHVRTFLIITGGYISYYFIEKKLHYFVLSLVALWVFFILRIALLEFQAKFSAYVGRSHILASSIVGFMFLATVHLSISEYYSIEYDNKFIGTQLEFSDGKTIATTYWYFYVGKTRNYVFLYDRKRASYDVIPLSTIKKLSIKHKFNRVRD